MIHSEKFEKLKPGKVSSDILTKIIFANLGVSGPDVLLGPAIGEDAAIISLAGKILVASTDPVTGSSKDLGWLAVHINANDVVTRGALPKWFLPNILLPKSATKETVLRICRQINSACKELDVAVIGGHTEITPGLPRPIVVGTMLGVTESNSYLATANIKAGDSIILTKYPGIEGTAILARECRDYLKGRLPDRIVANARRLLKQISVVREAQIAIKAGKVHAMHDPTEGGILGALHEMADSAKIGFRVYSQRLEVLPETIAICKVLRTDFLRLISSGTLLIAATPREAIAISKKIRSARIPARIIGEFTSSPSHRVIITDGSEEACPRPRTDQLWVALSRCNFAS